MDINKIRENSLKIADRMGVPINRALPLIDNSMQLRSTEEILKRLMCLHVTAACSFGFSREKAQKWLIQENIIFLLSESEKVFINRGVGDLERFKVQIEGMWALSWVLGLIPDLDFSNGCDKSFVFLLPNLKVLQPLVSVHAKAKCRSLNEIIEACDLAYCLHWGIKEAAINGKKLPSTINTYIIMERRRALEWVISNDNWDYISLDT